MAEPCALLPVENWNVKASTAIKNYEKKFENLLSTRWEVLLKYKNHGLM